MKEAEMRRIAAWMDEVIGNVDDEAVIERVRGEVKELLRALSRSRRPPGLARRQIEDVT